MRVKEPGPRESELGSWLNAGFSGENVFSFSLRVRRYHGGQVFLPFFEHFVTARTGLTVSPGCDENNLLYSEERLMYKGANLDG